MRLSTDAWIWEFRGQAYIFQNRTGMSYLMNETAFELLKCIRSAGEINMDELIRELAAQYDVEDCSVLSSDVKDYVRQLSQAQILTGADVSDGGGRQNAAEEFINRICIEKHLLQRVCIELTYRCNERCRHCYVADEDQNIKRELTYAQYTQILDELRRMNVLHITFTGGEVAVREDFIRIVEYAVNAGFAVEIYSNGIGFSEEIIDELDRIHPRSISFSLYSGIEEEHDAITQVKGSFRRTLNALMRLKCAGLLVSVKTVAMRPTMHGFEALLRLTKQLKVDLEVSYFVCASNQGCLSPTLLRLGDVESYKRIMRLMANERESQATVPRNIEDTPCGAGALSLSINPYGDVFPCNGYYLKLGNALSDGMEAIWNSPKLQDVYRQRFADIGEECVNCLYRDDCLFCMGAALAENGDTLKRIPETCLIAQATYEVRMEREALSLGE